MYMVNTNIMLDTEEQIRANWADIILVENSKLNHARFAYSFIRKFAQMIILKIGY